MREFEQALMQLDKLIESCPKKYKSQLFLLRGFVY